MGSVALRNIRKAYGAGLYAMCGPAFDPVATIALPSAKIAVMGPEAAVNAVFANKIAAIEDDEERDAFVEEQRQLYEEDVDLLRLASELVIDGIVGNSLRGAPRGRAAELIQWANDGNAPVLSLDAPSGLDTSTGIVFEPAIRAAATMTLALPKEGLRSAEAERIVGELYLADISVPPELYGREPLDLDVGAIFALGDIVRLA